VHLKCFICILMRMRRKVYCVPPRDVRSAFLHAILLGSCKSCLSLCLSPFLDWHWLTSLGSRQFMRPGPWAPRQTLNCCPDCPAVQLSDCRTVIDTSTLKSTLTYEYQLAVSSYELPGSRFQVPCACHQVGLKWQSRFNGCGQGKVTN